MIISIGKVKSIHMLKVFSAAAHYGSFTACGQRLHMTQSAVSQQVKRLEELVGSELFFPPGSRCKAHRSRPLASTTNRPTYINSK